MTSAKHGLPRKQGVASRIEAAKIVAKWLQSTSFPDRALERDFPDHAFVTDMVLGAVRRSRALSWAIERYARKYPTPEIRALLLCGAYQRLYMAGVADYAAIHATVEASRRFDERLAGFVNAVLRNILRNRDTLLDELRSQPLALRESHPDVLVDSWMRAYGPAKTIEICAADNAAPSVTITALPFTDAEKTAALVERINEAGLKAAVHPIEPGAIVIGHGARPSDLPGFADGGFIVQDPSTLLSVRLLAPREGETILDACAAPGGKTLQIAALVGPTGRVIAADAREDRLVRLRANVERAGFGDRVTVMRADAKAPPETPLHPDAILLDVPCSNTGVMRRRADARWRFDPRKALKAICIEQLAILENASRLGAGRIVYSTCSIQPEEDDGIVRAFLARNKGYALERSELILPDDSPRDGAFAALFVRTGADKAE